MIDVKEAARIAAEHLSELYESVEPDSIRLEEVELVNDECWVITLSFVDPRDRSPFGTVGPSPERQYKMFDIDAETGKMLSMKIRQLERA